MILSSVSSQKVLWFYLTKRFLMQLAIMTAILLSLVVFFDTIELLKRASDSHAVPFYRILQMSFLKLPDIAQTISPFIILFSTLMLLWSLNAKNEITIFRLSGFSVWQFMMPFIILSILIGTLMITIINPVSSVLLKKFNSLEQEYLSSDENEIALFRNGLWLKQPSENGYTILHAKTLDTNTWVLSNIMALTFNNQNQFLWRIDAPQATLQKGKWQFENAHMVSRTSKNMTLQEETEQHDVSISLTTTLTPQKIENSFSSTQTMSFWQLPYFIHTLETTGFDASSLRIHFQSMLALPLFFAALTLIAACVTLRPPRSQNAFKLIALGIGIGFALFFLSNFLKALGASSQIPIFIAAWAPVAITALFGGGILLSLEDG